MTEAQLRALLAVVDAGGFGAAAEALSMSQSGVSRAVRSLEAELGASLFARGQPSIALTPLGEHAVRRARSVVSEVDALRQEAAAARGGISGRVRLGSMPSVTATVLPELLGRLRRGYGAIEVVLLEGHDLELVEWVRNGTADVGVVAGEVPGLALQPLVTDDLLAALPADHPLAAGATVATAALAGEPFILTRAGCEALILDALAAAGVRPAVAYEVSEAPTILAMVGQGLGVSVVPSLVAREPPAGVALRPLDPPARRALSLAVPAGVDPTPAVRTLLSEARRYPRTRRPKSVT
jgi:DNA-binding transcriptional LysR family regulator